MSARRPTQPLLAAGLLLFASLGLLACQSTQSRSAELEEEGAKVLLEADGLAVGAENPDVEVTATTVIPAGTEGAVVVEVRNDSSRNLVDVPVSLEVLDAKGRVVYSNDAPGLEQALVAIPYIPANGESVWVNDQILATGTPATARVKVGVSPHTFSGEIPEIEVTEPTLEGGSVASGRVVNLTDSEQRRLLLYAIARRGGEVVAAGRGAFEHLKAERKPLNYHVYFLGDATGAEVEIFQFPTLPTEG